MTSDALLKRLAGIYQAMGAPAEIVDKVRNNQPVPPLESAKMKKITVWQVKVTSGDWEHNHIEDGWSERDMPQAINEAQAKAWGGKEWQRLHRYLDADNKIVSAS